VKSCSVPVPNTSALTSTRTLVLLPTVRSTSPVSPEYTPDEVNALVLVVVPPKIGRSR
jgi:hypothetical protein